MSADAFSLEGKRILVTGASSGLGRAIAIACAARGAAIVATGRDEMRLQETLSSLDGSGHSAVAADLVIAEARERVAQHTGNVSGVVHCAGVSRLSPIRMATETHIDGLWQINYVAPTMLTQRLLAKSQVEKEGSILFISSIAAYIGVPGVGVYSGTKAALIATTRCLAMELAKRKVRVNCLAPAVVKTPLTETLVDSMEEHAKGYPLGLGEPEDVANAAIYFLSNASRWVTGTTLVMDGGLTLT